MRPRRCDLADIADYRPASLDAAGHLDAGVALDLVADAHVLVVLHADAALGAGAYFVDVVLETPQRFEAAFEDLRETGRRWLPNLG